VVLTVAVLFKFEGLTGASANPPAPGSAPPILSAERLDDRIIVRVNDRTFTCYRFGTGQKYPYFHPVNGPVSGRSVTTESSLPYPHHRSLFFGCDRVNGGNYWQEGNDKGQIVSRGPRIAWNGPDYVLLLDDCDWRRPGMSPVMADHREIRIEAPAPDVRIIDFGVVLTALTEIRIEQTNHSLFSARVEDELSVKAGGTLVNAEGAEGERGTFGVRSPWCDYSGKRSGIVEGIALFDSPQNPWFPSRWFTRDYGFFSPTPMEWLDKDGFLLREGENLRLKYRVVVHAGNARQAGISRLFREWKDSQQIADCGLRIMQNACCFDSSFVICHSSF
jgi:hypothetical protein